ncbi:MAG: DUF3826 domain-containing protein [Phocaeicola sp.]
MKKISMSIMVIAILLVCQLRVLAQTPQVCSTRAITSEERATQLLQELALSDAQAAKFTPLFKKYQEDMSALSSARKELKKEARASNAEKVEPTDADLKKAAKERFSRQRKMIDLKEKYYTEFSKILTAKQVEKVMDAVKCREVRMHSRGGDETSSMNGAKLKGKEAAKCGVGCCSAK